MLRCASDTGIGLGRTVTITVKVRFTSYAIVRDTLFEVSVTVCENGSCYNVSNAMPC